MAKAILRHYVYGRGLWFLAALLAVAGPAQAATLSTYDGGGDGTEILVGGAGHTYLFEIQYDYNAELGLNDDSGNDVALILLVIPEPASATLLGLGSVALMARRRRAGRIAS